MPRENLDVVLIPGKIRKRGCSSSASSSSSSILQHYRLKRAVLFRNRAGSCTPVPTWRLVRSRSLPPASQSRGRKSNQAQISARKLAASLWQISKLPLMEEELELDKRRLKNELRDRVISAHRPVSERIDRMATGIDFSGKACVMEVENRSRTRIPIISTTTRLKDISNVLTASKELVKIINRVWAHEHRPSSSMSLVSALHAELQRGRSLVNQLIHDQQSDRNDMNRPMRRFTEEKGALKSELVIEVIAGELETERELRRRFESFNKKLGRELEETKLAFVKLGKEHESEKRAREIIEQLCEELVRGIESEVAVHESNGFDQNSLFWENSDVSEASKRTKQIKYRSNDPNGMEISGFTGRNHLNLHQIKEFYDGESKNRSECFEDLIIGNDEKGVARDRRNPSINKGGEGSRSRKAAQNIPRAFYI